MFRHFLALHPKGTIVFTTAASDKLFVLRSSQLRELRFIHVREGTTSQLLQSSHATVEWNPSIASFRIVLGPTEVLLAMRRCIGSSEFILVHWALRGMDYDDIERAGTGSADISVVVDHASRTIAHVNMADAHPSK